MLPLLTTQSEAAAPPIGKVELDLEGAPFLEPDPEEAPEAPASSADAPKAVEGGDKPPKNRKKLFIIAGAALLVLIIAAVLLAYFLLFSSESKELPPDVPVIVVPSGLPTEEPAPVDKFHVTWEPFWVEVADPEGEIRFVYCKIVLVTDNQRIALQLDQKQTLIRDAVYYYLRNKPYSFLADLKQLDTLKVEMLNIINYYILPETVIPPGLAPGEGPPPGSPKERLKEILIEEYLVK